MAFTFERPLKLCATFTMAMGLAATSAAGESVLVTDPGARQVRNNGSTDFAGTLGYDIQVGGADVEVTHLGIWDGPGNETTSDKGTPGDGLEQSAMVGIYLASDRRLIAETTIPAGTEGKLEGEFRYVALDKPVTLTAGQTYRIATSYDKGGNAFRNYHNGRAGPKVSEHFAVSQLAYHASGNRERLVFPAGQREGSIYIGPNFRYTGGAAVPQPEPTEAPGDRLKDADAQPGRLLLTEGFEDTPAGELPKGWTMEPASQSRESFVKIDQPGAGYAGHSLNLRRDGSVAEQDGFGGLTYRLDEPAARIALTFDYRVQAERSNAPAVEVFTLGPDSIEPTQLRLRIMQDRLQQYGGIQLGWVNVPITGASAGRTFTATAPWYRVRLVIDQKAEGIAVHISDANSPEVSSEPVAIVPANGIGQSIAAIRLVSSQSVVNQVWIDNVTLHAGDEIPAPGEPALRPDLTEGYQLWTGETYPRSFADIAYPEGIEYSIVYRNVRPWRWYHGSSLEVHNGKMYASWGANDKGENVPGEVVLYNTSSDGGKTWSEAKVLAPGDGEGGTEYSNSHGTLLSHDGKLWGFFQHWAGGWDNPLSTEAFILNEETDEWESQGIVATQGWALDRPKKTDDGNWVMGVSGFRMQRPAAMVSDGDNLLKWDTIAIPTAGQERRFPETSLIVDGNDVWSITRWEDRQRVLVSTSNDGGRTWAEAQHSNMPMDTSKPDSGTLSTGQWFLVINVEDRQALMIAVGKPGEKGFSKLYKIRYGSPPTEHGYDGSPNPRRYAYPYSIEHDGKLYVTYSVRLADVEVAIIPIESLKAE